MCRRNDLTYLRRSMLGDDHRIVSVLLNDDDWAKVARIQVACTVTVSPSTWPGFVWFYPALQGDDAADIIMICWEYPGLQGMEDAADTHVICWEYPGLRGMDDAVDMHVICWEYPALQGMEDAVDIDVHCLFDTSRLSNDGRGRREIRK